MFFEWLYGIDGVVAVRSEGMLLYPPAIDFVAYCELCALFRRWGQDVKPLQPLEAGAKHARHDPLDERDDVDEPTHHEGFIPHPESPTVRLPGGWTIGYAHLDGTIWTPAGRFGGMYWFVHASAEDPKFYCVFQGERGQHFAWRHTDPNVVALHCGPWFFFSGHDVQAFYEWLHRIDGVICYFGERDRLTILLHRPTLTKESYQSFVGLFRRYGIDLATLQTLADLKPTRAVGF